MAAVATSAILSAAEVAAQVAEDQSLGSESTSVEPIDIAPGNGIFEIRDGATRGASDQLLFHSFDSFSVGTGQTAEFITDSNISTIFGRVTGGTLSQIDGTISTGAVDLFLINPAGVVFGPESFIDIDGSVMVSTAESLTFTDGVEFSTLDPQLVPLLTVSQPIGLSLGETAGKIEIGSQFLSFNQNETALFAGNEITLPGGGAIIPSGRIELVSLAPGSRIELVPSDESLVSRFDIDQENFSELRLSNIDALGGVLDTSSIAGNSDNVSGQIVLAGQQIQILDDGEFPSEIFSENNGSSLGEGISILASANLSVNNSIISTDTFAMGDGGDLSIAVNGPLSLLNGSRLLSRSGDSERTTESERAAGAAGTLTIRAQQLSVQGGSLVSTSTFIDGGPGGNLLIDVPNGRVEVSGVVPIVNSEPEISSLTAFTRGDQNAGKIQINAENLTVRSGGQIDTSAGDDGDSGGITINATDSIVVIGESNNILSAITSSNNRSSNGDAGPISLTTRRLLIADGGQVFTSTNGNGDGGDLTIQAEEVILSGVGTAEDKLFGLFARTEGSGSSGRLDLTTESLIVRDGARLTVSTDEDAEMTESLGTVRDATIAAHQIVLDNGRITAESLSGNGGTLNFEIQDFLLLRNNSLISATAGTAAAGGDGGNINISAPAGFIVAAPDQNSDIIANAFSGTGGDVDITTQSILGLEAREAIANNTTNDIDASSEFGVAGTILFNNLELDPTEGIVELPTEAVAPGQVAQRCLADSEGRNAFIITGQGGVPPNPGDVIRNENLRSSPTADAASASSSEVSGLSEASFEVPPEVSMVEASGWQRDLKGNVVLVATDPIVAQASRTHYHSCVDSQSIVQQSR
ncbi:MAG: filamentous hemagglutinin N-terminal domain-containing protein [Cyanobacteria bacterium P01_D01_bin.1]